MTREPEKTAHFEQVNHHNEVNFKSRGRGDDLMTGLLAGPYGRKYPPVVVVLVKDLLRVSGKSRDFAVATLGMLSPMSY